MNLWTLQLVVWFSCELITPFFNNPHQLTSQSFMASHILRPAVVCFFKLYLSDKEKVFSLFNYEPELPPVIRDLRALWTCWYSNWKRIYSTLPYFNVSLFLCFPLLSSTYAIVLGKPALAICFLFCLLFICMISFIAKYLLVLIFFLCLHCMKGTIQVLFVSLIFYYTATYSLNLPADKTHWS